jgi:hypothetical protein
MLTTRPLKPLAWRCNSIPSYAFMTFARLTSSLRHLQQFELLHTAYCADVDKRGNVMLIPHKGCLLIHHRVNIRSDSFITPLRSFITETHINMTTDCGSALIGDTHLSAYSLHDGNPMSNRSSDRGFVIQSDRIITITRRYMPCHVISWTLNFRTHEGRNTVNLLI